MNILTKQAEPISSLAMPANKEIAFRLGLVRPTIKRLVHSLMRKLGAKNRAGVAVVALRGGLVDLPVLPEQAEPHLGQKKRPGPQPQNHGYSLMCDDINRAGQNREIVETGVGDPFYDKQQHLLHNWPLEGRPPKGLILGELTSSALPKFADKFGTAASPAAGTK